MTREITHECPPGGKAATPCCGKTPFELPRMDRMTTDKGLVNCRLFALLDSLSAKVSQLEREKQELVEALEPLRQSYCQRHCGPHIHLNLCIQADIATKGER